MSSTSGQSMNYLSPPYANSDCSSLRSFSSICSSISSRGPGEVHINAAYDCSENGDVISSSNHDYEDLQSIRTDFKELHVPAQGPRRKANELYEPTGPLKERVRQITECLDDEDLQSIRTDFTELPAHGRRSKINDVYEPTGPMKHRERQITECSDDSNASTASDSFHGKKESCLSKLILFLILAFSVAALVLVILIINGTVGPKCGCKDLNAENNVNAPSTGMQSVSVQNLLRRIEDLENNMSAMEAKMKARDSAVEMFVTKHESQVEVLQAQVNDTANKVATVNGVWVNMTNTHDAFEKKLDTEFKHLNKSVKELNKNDEEITSSVDELRQNQILTKRMNERLAINVTQLETHVQGLRKTSSNISSRVASLEKGYIQMNTLIKTMEAINGAQNATHQDLQSMHKRLRDSLTAVNSTLNDKLKRLGSNTGEPAANFSMCKHKMISGTPSTAGNSAGKADVFYSEPKGQRAMGMTCSTNYARHYQLSEVSKGSFKCTCYAVSPVFGVQSRSMGCYLHVWECPI